MTSLTLTRAAWAQAGVPILQDISLKLGPVGSVAIIGPNGAGKSSLLRLMAGLAAPTAGTVRMDDLDLHNLGTKARARAIGYLPQQFEPYWDLTARELVELGAERAAVSSTAQVNKVVAEFELEGLLDRRWSTLSGGERSRVLLAMVIVVDPPILLADEPSAALDIQHRLSLVENLVSRGRDRLCVVVMHDLDLTMRFFERVILVDGGRVIADGPAWAMIQDRSLDAAFKVAFERIPHEGGLLLHPGALSPAADRDERR